MAAGRAVDDICNMPDTIGHLLPYLIPMHELVDCSGGEGLHGFPDADAEIRAVRRCSNHGLIQETFRLANMEMTRAADYVRVCVWLAGTVEIISIVNKRFHTRYGAGIAPRLIDLPIHITDVAAGIDRGVSILLLDIWRKPAVKRIISAVCHSVDSFRHDARERYESGVDDEAIALVFVARLVVADVKEFVRCGCGIGRRICIVGGRDDRNSNLWLSGGCGEYVLWQCGNSEEKRRSVSCPHVYAADRWLLLLQLQWLP